jgi:hypothetical protein
MLFPDVGDLSDFIQLVRDRGTEAALAGGEFTVVDQVYREGYAKLYAVYEDVVTARESIGSRVAAIDVGTVSRPIAGVLTGATQTRRTVDNPTADSLTTSLTVLEAEITRTLQAMYDSYVAYQRTDEEAAFALIRRAATSP